METKTWTREDRDRESGTPSERDRHLKTDTERIIETDKPTQRRTTSLVVLSPFSHGECAGSVNRTWFGL